MPKLVFQLTSVTRELDNGSRLVEPLLFSEILCHGRDIRQTHRAVVRRVREVLRDTATERLYQFRLPGRVRRAEFLLEIPPPTQTPSWRKPVQLLLPYAVWEHGRDAVVAFVPSLNIQLLAKDTSELTELLVKQARDALARRQLAGSLRHLVWLDRIQRMTLKGLTVHITVPTPKEQARQLAEEDERHQGVLKTVATDLTLESMPPVFEMSELVQEVTDVLLAKQGRSVLLIGPSGVGKTALVHELVRRRGELQLGDRPFWSTSGARLIAGASGFGMWQDRCQKLVAEASRGRAVLHLGNLPELIEVGRCEGSSQGIASFLRTFLARGDLVAIAECTAEELPVIEREDPQLAAAFHYLRVPEPDEARGRTILYECALHFRQHGREGKGRAVSFDAAALDQLDELHRRFATYSAYPGRPLRFLRNLLSDYRSEVPLSAAHVTEAFSRETGLPRFMLDPSLPMQPGADTAGATDLEQVRGWFEQRVMGQSDAHERVVSLLATIKAGLTRGGKPLASLLFLGPTGVGKTEMAKSICEFLYRDPGRMVRFDMSEYADPFSVSRLITGSSGRPGLLPAKVREQPFTVVLFDEIEKADASFFDLLLQTLGEGRLTDAQGRTADFRSSVVILTSNLGAESYARGGTGFGDSAAEFEQAEQQMLRKVRDFFRPELFNRFDQIVPFAPLSRATIQALARRELDAVIQRDGLRFRAATMRVDDPTVQWLAETGYHPRYGARPLKRTVEQRLVAPLADELLQNHGDAPVSISVAVGADGPRISVQRVESLAGRLPSSRDATLEAIVGIVDLRRNVQSLDRSSAVLRLRNEIVRLEQQRRQFERGQQRRSRRTFFPRGAELTALVEQEARIAGVRDEVFALEDEVLFAFHQQQAHDLSLAVAASRRLDGRLRELLMELYLRDVGAARLVTLAIFGEQLQLALQLARAYDEFAAGRKLAVQRYHLMAYRRELDPEADAERPSRTRRPRGTAGAAQERLPSLRLTSRPAAESEPPVKTVDAFFVSEQDDFYDGPPAGRIGVALQIQGDGAFMWLAGEQGLHEFKHRGRSELCLVETVSGLLIGLEPPANIHRRGTVASQAGQKNRRIYDLDAGLIHDPPLRCQWPWRRDAFSATIRDAVERYVSEKAWKILQS
jgi:ATP-dependent Clp protease ATP-binding subunit ClpA